MKIGIFGDSFADWAHLLQQDTTNKPWASYLTDHGHIVTNFAKSGSSLVFSYMEYMKHHDQFDKVIFVLTSHSRILLPKEVVEGMNLPVGCDNPHVTSGITGRWEEELKRNKGMSLYEYELKSAVLNYYKYIYNKEVDEVFYDLMVDKLVSHSGTKNKNMLILPTTPHHLGPNIVSLNIPGSIQTSNQTFNLNDISAIDGEYYNIGSHFRDARACHMNSKNNKIFADCILSWIDNGVFTIDISMFTHEARGIEYILIKD